MEVDVTTPQATKKKETQKCFILFDSYTGSSFTAMQIF